MTLDLALEIERSVGSYVPDENPNAHRHEVSDRDRADFSKGARATMAKKKAAKKVGKSNPVGAAKKSTKAKSRPRATKSPAVQPPHWDVEGLQKILLDLLKVATRILEALEKHARTRDEPSDGRAPAGGSAMAGAFNKWTRHICNVLCVNNVGRSLSERELVVQVCGVSGDDPNDPDNRNQIVGRAQEMDAFVPPSYTCTGECRTRCPG
jgi:hypothetical protein